MSAVASPPSTLSLLEPAQRHQTILDLLESAGTVQVSDLAARLEVSEMTVRRDLESLEGIGALNRVHGGAVPARSQSYEPPFSARLQRNLEAKRRIGVAAAALLHEGETAILDAGTTTLAVADALKGRRNLRLFMLSLHLADRLVDEPNLTVMVGGGIARPGERSLIGQLAEQSFDGFSFDTLFLTVGGIAIDAGATEYNLDDAAVKRAAFAAARRRIAVADSSKLGKHAFARVCALDELDLLVTDDAAPGELLDEIRALGVEVLVA